MKNPLNARAPTFDAASIQQTIERALASAGLSTDSGPMQDVTRTIRRALAGAGLADAARDGLEGVIDVDARVVDAQAAQSATPSGAFTTHAFRSAAGARAYKLYVPAGTGAAPRPMVVMLHGCTQSADDFAAGTRMNRLADTHGLLVVYPEQAAQANASRCWNWFQPQDQGRDAGEPALIAGIVREVAARHPVDTRRVYVAGLSAGAAMALVLAETHPDLVAGVGVHSGLPYGSAHDIPSALQAMKGGRSGRAAAPRPAAAPAKNLSHAVPLIVFHGDRDHTVQASNAAEIVRQAHEAHLAQAGAQGLSTHTERGQSPGGRSYSRTRHADAAGQARIECWTLHGAGHAWSGGDAGGSYTDAAGPDASAEMVRFFLGLEPRTAA